MRPQPPAHLLEPTGTPSFAPDDDLTLWAIETFITGDGPLVHEAHSHLRDAEIRVCWTNAPASRQGKTILGQCEQIQYGAGLWSKARGIHLLNEWFDTEIDFLITLYAPAWVEMSDRQALALVSHEIFHAGQKLDLYGNPCFSTHDGSPIFAIKPHCVEEFVGVVEQFGATSSALRIMAESIMAGPLIDDETIEIACGVCLRA